MKLQLRLSKIIVPSIVAILATVVFLIALIYSIVIKNYVWAFASVSVLTFSFPFIFMATIWNKYLEFASWREFLLTELESKRATELQNTDNPVLLSEKEVIEFYRQLIPSYDRCIMGGLYNPLFLTDSIEYFREIIKYEDEEQESITSQKK